MSSPLNKRDLKKILIKLGIKPKDKLQVSSNLLPILSLKKSRLKPKEIINLLIELVTSKGTIFFPTFNWGFCEGEAFNYLKTKSLTGSLGNLALKRKDFLRSINPIYSFSIFGKDKKKIAKMCHKSCFGLNSPFGFLIKNGGKNLFIDLDYKAALTYAHVAEETVGVNYRYLKTFNGDYYDIKNKKRKVSYKMYVRKLKLVKSTLVHKDFDKLLRRNQALKKINFKGHQFSMIDIKKTYMLMVNDISKKKGMVYPVLYKNL